MTMDHGQILTDDELESLMVDQPTPAEVCTELGQEDSDPHGSMEMLAGLLLGLGAVLALIVIGHVVARLAS